MDKHAAKAKLDAYLDPGLAESDRAALEAAVLADSAAAAELEALKDVDDELRSLPAPEPPDGYHTTFAASLDKRIAEEELDAGRPTPVIPVPVAWAAAIATTPEGPERTSGTYNISALARSTVSTAAAPQALPTASELSGGVVRSSVVGIKVAVPAAETAARPSWLPLALGATFVLVIAAGAMAWKLMNKPAPSSTEAVALNVPVPAPGLQPPAQQQPASAPLASPPTPTPAVPRAADPIATGQAVAAADKAAEGEAKSPAGAASKKHGASGAGRAAHAHAAAATAPAAPAAAPAAEAPAKPQKSADDLDALLSSATKGSARPKVEEDGESGGSRKAKAEPAASEGAPAEIGINDIRKVLDGLAPKMRQCFKRFQIAGTAEVSVVVASTGKLQSSSLKGDFLGTPTGTCVLAQLKTASFPAFKGNPMTITYPFNLH